MTKTQGSAVIAQLILVLASMAWPMLARSAPEAATLWEYAAIAMGDRKLASDMRTAGQNGWEIGAARRANVGVANVWNPGAQMVMAYELILKRPLRSP